MAAEAAEKGSPFNTERKFSVRIFNVTAQEENRIFYAYNQEGQKADATRSKWLYQVGATKLAASLVEKSRHLNSNVDTIRNKLSRRNPRLCAFNTLSRAFEEHWTDIDVEDKETFESKLDYLLRFWDKLISVRSELGCLKMEKRQKLRELSLVDSALAVFAYVGLAKRMLDKEIDLTALEKLAFPVKLDENGNSVDFFSRSNPIWQKIGVLVPTIKKNGEETLQLRNNRDAQAAFIQQVFQLVDSENSQVKNNSLV